MGFEYHPLEALDFCILLLSPGEESDQPKATLKHVSLADYSMPEYETNSYACGEPSLTASILIDGKLLAIPASSAEALHSIYRRKWFSRLWVLQEAFLSSVNNCICWGVMIPLHDLLAMTSECLLLDASTRPSRQCSDTFNLDICAKWKLLCSNAASSFCQLSSPK